ncbi:putative lipopolysaccharide heptosyltransferase III [Candidatus Thiothrix anitrata]|uniref:Lipopolysaccharide heptosyltransferase III n=1 Tax=Candidatus Thiothrix anitrata TaxID=2823902 RepID=A0ABX7WZS4_9GAMM|nr:putative lipopolysaccharide heptosyltransferase III [Candidatus Thiothrix anitrata]QTR48841.1 putative lipopolysaccharide heptosyltransferase III [Candidatus Thiothrix anitrata]
MRILVITFRNIGDVLLSSPLLSNLRYHYPDAVIDYVLNDYCEDMIKYNPDVNNFYSYNRSYVKKLNRVDMFFDELRFLRSILKSHYDVVINLTEGMRGDCIAFLSSSKIKIGFSGKKKSFVKKFFLNHIVDIKYMHMVENKLLPLQCLNKEVVTKKVSLYWSNSDQENVDKLLVSYDLNGKDFVHIHPVARWMFKAWSAESFANVIDHIENCCGKKVILTSSDDMIEKNEIYKILALCESKPINLAGQLSLTSLACLSSKAAFFIGVDSAPMHMAAAVNIPVIALFGNSDALLWGPWSNDGINSSYNDSGRSQINGKHHVIQYEKGMIISNNGIKLSSSMNKILPRDVKNIVDQYMQVI